MRIADYARLWRLARARKRSREDYRAFQRFQASRLAKYLESRGARIRGARLLDLGSGFGGYAAEFASRGARVVGLDLVQPGGLERDGILPVRGSALDVPLRDSAFDLVFCASLIEHVEDPGRLLAEIARVLRPAGYAYVSFPPYWSPVGGHEFSPFHYFGERLALRLARGRGDPPEWIHRVQEATDEPRSFAELYRGWGLRRMTIRRMRRLVAASDLDALDVSTRYLPVSFVRWPLIGEVLTWHAQFLLRRPPPPPPPTSPTARGGSSARTKAR